MIKYILMFCFCVNFYLAAANYISLIGCFGYDPSFLPYERFDSTSFMTNDRCAQHCCTFVVGATHCGTKNGKECHCGIKESDPVTNIDISECDMPCTGNASEICGSNDRFSVSKLNCSEIQRLGCQVSSTVEPLAEHTESTIEPTVESTIEPTVESTVESTVKPTVESTVKPTIESTVTPTIESTVKSTDKSTFECTVEPTAKPTIIVPNVDLNAKIIAITEEIRVDKTKTGSFKRTKESAQDDRKSSRYIGVGGIVVIVLPFITVILSDILSLFKNKKDQTYSFND